MVDVLWEHNLEATLALEALWSEIVADQDVSLSVLERARMHYEIAASARESA